MKRFNHRRSLSLSFLNRIVEDNVWRFTDIIVIDLLTGKKLKLERDFRFEMPEEPTQEEKEERIQNWIELDHFLPEKYRNPVISFNCEKENHETRI